MFATCSTCTLLWAGAILWSAIVKRLGRLHGQWGGGACVDSIIICMLTFVWSGGHLPFTTHFRGGCSWIGAPDILFHVYKHTHTHTHNHDSCFSEVATFFNFAKASVGSGSFALPWGILQCGVLLGSAGMVLLGIVRWVKYNTPICTLQYLRTSTFCPKLSLRPY